MKIFDKTSNPYLTDTNECRARIFRCEENKSKMNHNKMMTTEINRMFSILPRGKNNAGTLAQTLSPFETEINPVTVCCSTNFINILSEIPL